MLQAGGPQAYTYTGHLNGSKGRITQFHGIYKVKWKHGTNGRQGNIGNLEIKSWFRRLSPSGDLRCFFLPLM